MHACEERGPAYVHVDMHPRHHPPTPPMPDVPLDVCGGGEEAELSIDERVVGQCVQLGQLDAGEGGEAPGEKGGRRRERRAGRTGVEGGNVARVGKIGLSE